MAMVCCLACRSHPRIFISASSVPNLCVGHHKVYSGRREADVVMSSTNPARGFAARIRRMANRATGILSRLTFVVCGIVSVLMGNLYRAVLGAPGPIVYGHWDVRSLSLILVGGFAVVLAMLPSSWFAMRPGDQSRSAVPLKVLGGFAAFSYLLTVGLFFVPSSWHPSPWLLFSLWPTCVLTITVDPSLSSVLFLLAPLDAAIHGAVGAIVGSVVVFVRNRTH
jgi:hypothetical protein